ncbi:protein-(glutamine-N5) methyltransferase, release factor-specific [bacterium DOLZORAL124_38_8]|nr:MAG: protein-(glutamine-N5) methyltransferase, release factor-specific [bacterium DOLZORAL124_38_8]
MNFITFVLSKQSVQSAVFWAQKHLSELENPQFEAEFLLSSLLKRSMTELRTHPKTELTVSQKETFFRCIKKRKKRIPAAYILGYKQWNGYQIKVNKNTLIPRDETEVLIQHIQTESRDFTPTKILDLGTGSGCIALAMQDIFPTSKIEAVDISGMALKVAKQNIRTLAKYPENVSFWQSNLLDSLLPSQAYQIIVANLPYVPTTTTISPEVKQEPPQAIFSGDDGLNLIRTLAEQLKTKDILFKELWLEFLPESADTIKQIFAEYQVCFKNDVSGKPFFACIKPNQN